MKATIDTVQFANRADLQPASYAVGAHMPQGVVTLNVFVGGKTHCVEMTPEEAREVAGYLTKSADDVEHL